MDRSPNKVTSNGVDDSGTRKQGAEKETRPELGDQLSTGKVASEAEVDDSEAGRSANVESELDNPAGKRGNKSNASSNVSESSDTSHVDGDKEVEKLPDRQHSHGKDLHGSPGQEVNSVVAKPSVKDTSTDLSTPKASETEVERVASPTLSGTIHDDRRLKKASRAKKKGSVVQEETPLVDLLPKKVVEGTNDSELKPNRRTGKKAPADVADEDKMSADADTSKISSGGASDSGAKRMEEMDRKVEESSNIEDAPSSKKKKDGKKRARGKAALENEGPKSSAKDDQKVISLSQVICA